MPEYQCRAAIDSGDPIVRAYLECAEWCGLSDEDRDSFELAVSPRWSIDAIDAARSTVDEFLTLCREFGYGFGDLSDSELGDDLWLTRNHHGAGFWDRGLGKIGDDLTTVAHTFGECYVLWDANTETLSLWEG